MRSRPNWRFVYWAVLGLAIDLGSALAEELSPESYDRLRAAIDVTAEDLRWQEVPWRSCWDGLVEAQRADRPIFYWIYFGDPRGGC